MVENEFFKKKKKTLVRLIAIGIRTALIATIGGGPTHAFLPSPGQEYSTRPGQILPSLDELSSASRRCHRGSVRHHTATQWTPTAQRTVTPRRVHVLLSAVSPALVCFGFPLKEAAYYFVVGFVCQLEFPLSPHCKIIGLWLSTPNLTYSLIFLSYKPSNITNSIIVDDKFKPWILFNLTAKGLLLKSSFLFIRVKNNCIRHTYNATVHIAI